MTTVEIAPVVSDNQQLKLISREEGIAKVRRALRHAGTPVPVRMSRKIFAIHLEQLGCTLNPNPQQQLFAS